MSRFWDYAQRIFDTACQAAAVGEPANLVILVNREGGLQVTEAAGWSLAALQAHTGARMLFRVTHERGRVRVEGREGATCCRMESERPRSHPAPALSSYCGRWALPAGEAPNWENLGAGDPYRAPAPPPQSTLAEPAPAGRLLLSWG